MNTMLSLIKLQLNSNFGISALKYKFTKEKKKRWEPVLIGLSILFGVGSLLVLYTLGMTGLFIAGKAIGHPEIVLTIAFMGAQLFILVFGMFYILGAFYFSRDLEMLVPLPLKPYEVIGGKFAVVMVNEYLTVFPIILPPLLIYGIGTGQGLFYWVKGLILLLTAPAIPLIIGALFIMLLMRVVNLRRNKDLFAIIGGFTGLILALGFNLIFQNVPENAGADYFQSILASQYGLIEAIGNKFPPAIWATLGLSQGGTFGFGQFLLFLAVSLLMLAAMLWLSNQVFYKALLAGQEVSRKRKVLSNIDFRRQYDRASSPVWAILAREWKLLMRSPLYVINGMTGAVIGPFLVIVLALTRGSDEDSMMIMNALNNPDYAVYVTLGGLGLMLFTAGMNIVASTAVSREGQTFWIAKMIPVAGRQQVIGKFLHGWLISLIGIITTCIALAIFPGFSISRILVIALLAVICSISMIALNLLIDIIRPKLFWNSEQEAMKQNLNGGLGMLVSVINIVLLAAAAIIPIILQMPEWTSFLAVGILAVIIDIVSLTAVLKIADRRYKQIEV